jgi:S1-C subfamily serine protease
MGCRNLAEGRPGAGWKAVAAAVGLWALLAAAGAVPQGSQSAGSGPGSSSRVRIVVRAPADRGGNAARGAGNLIRPGKALPSDDWTFRPTVLVRRGTSQGSGTIIASIHGQTLVLTAAHVVKNPAPIFVELHRYNLGLENRAAPGNWPRIVSAGIAAMDSAADLAVLRIERMVALPYVARLSPENAQAAPETVVTSVGIDLGVKLGSWTTRLLETRKFELNDSGEARPFVLTAHPPEHGRSGGGLFLPGGELAGVCIGHTEISGGQTVGVFSAREAIDQLLSDHGLTALVALSERRRIRLKSPAPKPARATSPRSPTSVTPTRAVGADHSGTP